MKVFILLGNLFITNLFPLGFYLDLNKVFLLQKNLAIA